MKAKVVVAKADEPTANGNMYPRDVLSKAVKCGLKGKVNESGVATTMIDLTERQEKRVREGHTHGLSIVEEAE